MLISRFNRMIRSRVLWSILGGLFALTMIDFVGPGASCVSGRNRARNGQSEGRLFGQDIGAREFNEARFFELGLRDRGALSEAIEQQVRQRTWKRLAALRAAEEMGLRATDDELRAMLARDQAFQSNGAFDAARYRAVIEQQVRVPVSVFETYLRQDLTLRKLQATLGATVWTPPAETDEKLRNICDTFSVAYLRLGEESLPAAAPLTDEALRAFHAENKDLFVEPERLSLSYVAFPAASFTNIAAVGDDEIATYYENNLDAYTRVTTNETTETTPLDEVRAEIGALLHDRAALAAARDAALDFAVGLSEMTNGPAAFADMARARGLAVRQPPPFGMQEPVAGVQDGERVFRAAAFRLDPSLPELAVSDPVMGSNTVYLIKAEARIPTREPAFEEMVTRVRPLAERAAKRRALEERARAVRDTVEVALQAGRPFTAAADDLKLAVHTTQPFTVYNEEPVEFENSDRIMQNVMTLAQGELSDWVATTNGLLLLYVSAREPGNLLQMEMLRPQLVESINRHRTGALFDEWLDATLARAELEDYRAPRPADDAATTAP